MQLYHHFGGRGPNKPQFPYKNWVNLTYLWKIYFVNSYDSSSSKYPHPSPATMKFLTKDVQPVPLPCESGPV